MATQPATARRRFRLNTPRLNLWLDLALLVVFVMELELDFTGLTLHEWLGMGMGAALILHIVLHWRWIVNVTRTFFRKLLHESRLNYLLNLLLLADLGVIIVTGVLITRTLGLDFGLTRATSHNIQRWHILASNFSLLLVGLHVALHWKWIANNAARYLVPRLSWRRSRTTSESAQTALNPQSVGGES